MMDSPGVSIGLAMFNIVIDSLDKGIKCPSVNLQMTPQCEEVSIYLRVGKLYRGTWASWIDELRPIV